MSELPTAEETISRSRASHLPPAAVEERLRREAMHHTLAAEKIFAVTTRTASDNRRANFHIRQAEAIIAEADGYVIDYGQVVRAEGDPAESRDPRHRERNDATYREAEQRTAELNKIGLLDSRGAEAVTDLLEHGESRDQRMARRWAAAAGDLAYTRAFAKVVADPVGGHRNWSPEEYAAYQRANEVDAELRSLVVGTGSAGGFLAPTHLDPAILLRSAGVRSPLRDIARVETLVTGPTWNGVTSTGVTAAWYAEAAQVAESTPTLVNPQITPERLSIYSEFSFELQDDAIRLVEQLQRLMADAAVIKTETAYATGAGHASNEPQGLVTGLAAVAASASTVTAAGEALAAADLYKLQADLAPRWQDNASFLAHLATINTIAQFETTNGAKQFPEVAEDRLLRRPLHEVSTLDSVVNPAATEANYLVAYGDWKSCFVIVDRIGARFELVPHVLGDAQRPTGERGLLMWMRTGSGVVAPEAGRLLNVATAA